MLTPTPVAVDLSRQEHRKCRGIMQSMANAESMSISGNESSGPVEKIKSIVTCSVNLMGKEVPVGAIAGAILAVGFLIGFKPALVLTGASYL